MWCFQASNGHELLPMDAVHRNSPDLGTADEDVTVLDLNLKL